MIQYESISTTWQDYPSREDIAVLVFFSGCIHNCKGCHNPELQKRNPSYSKSIEEFYRELYYKCYSNRTNKVVLEGGDPLYGDNLLSTKELLSYNKDLHFCIYTGYMIEYVKEIKLTGFDYIKCGKYDIDNKCQSQKNDNELIFASTNQKLYDKDYNQISNNNVYKIKE
jgi:anaerobic ribonucleoside-triphosphate reductase activating protein